MPFLVFFFLAAEARVGFSFPQKLFFDLFVEVHPLALAIRPVVSLLQGGLIGCDA